MSNLSDLLPTGGGQNAVDFVASGTLGSGQTVVLNSNGTVSVISAISQSLGSPAVFQGSAALSNSATFDSTNNKVVVAYRDGGNSFFATAVVGTVSGASISFGTPVVFNGSAQDLAITFDSFNSKIVIAFRDNTNATYGTAIVGTVSGTSISFGTKVVFESAEANYISATFDSNANKVVISYKDRGNNFGTAAVGTVSGTGISFGTPVVFQSSETNYTSATFDSTNNKVVIAYQNSANSSYGTAVVGTVSGTSISFGTPVVFANANVSWVSIAFDSNNSKVVIAYTDNAPNPYYGTAVVGTVSGTAISFGTPVVFSSANANRYSVVFNSSSNKIVISYKDQTNSGFGTLVVGVVSGTSISFGSSVVYESATTESITSTFDSTNNKVVIAYEDQGNAQKGTAIVFETASTNNTSFIGITAEAIADTATGPVNVFGGINEAQSGLTIGSDYYVQADGSIATTVSDVKIGQAISATTINMMDLT